MKIALTSSKRMIIYVNLCNFANNYFKQKSVSDILPRPVYKNSSVHFWGLHICFNLLNKICS